MYLSFCSRISSQTTVSGKRKAEEAAPPAKKVKLADGAAAPADEEAGTSVFVGGLSWNVDNDQLASEFAGCGEVVSARVVMDRNTGKSRGFAYVDFTDAAGATAALELSGHEIDGRAIRVDRASGMDKKQTQDKRAKTFGDTPSAPSATLWVGNLSFDATEDGIWEVFNEYGEVKSVRLPTDRDTGRPKGFGYVEFADVETATKAREGANGQDVGGRSMRLDFAPPRDESGGGRGGFGGRGGGRGGRGGFDGGRGGRGGGRGGFGGFGGDRGGRGGGRGGFGDRGGRGGRGVSISVDYMLATTLMFISRVVAAAVVVLALVASQTTRAGRPRSDHLSIPYPCLHA